MTGKSISLCTVLGYSILAVSVGIFVLFEYILLVRRFCQVVGSSTFPGWLSKFGRCAGKII
jgi:hypothetical protein